MKKGKVSPHEAEKALKRIKTTVSLEETVRDADFVTEAVPENLSLKQ